MSDLFVTGSPKTIVRVGQPKNKKVERQVVLTTARRNQNEEQSFHLQKRKSYKPKPLNSESEISKKLYNDGIEKRKKMEDCMEEFYTILGNETKELQNSRNDNQKKYIRQLIKTETRDYILSNNRLRDKKERLLELGFERAAESIDTLTIQDIESLVKKDANRFRSLTPFTNKREQRESSNRLFMQGLNPVRPYRGIY